MPRLCSYYNSEVGCKKSAEECKFSHESYCTNDACAKSYQTHSFANCGLPGGGFVPCTNAICVELKKNRTHTFANCGQKGGGMHHAFIEKKRKEALVAKTQKKAAEATVRQTCEELYVKVSALLDAKTVADAKENWAINLAGKLVGMFAAGLPLDELNNLIANQELLQERIQEGINVIAQSRKNENPS